MIREPFLKTLFRPGELSRIENIGDAIWVGKVVNPERERLEELSALGPVATVAVLDREYSEDELANAELLRILWKSPSTLVDDTIECYDLSRCCPHCGRGLSQIRDLRFNLRAARNQSGIRYVRSAGEVLIEDSKASLLTKQGLTGFHLRPVMQGPKLNYREVPSGRLLMQYVKENGGEAPAAFFCDCEDAEEKQHLRELFSKAHAEAAESPKLKPDKTWRQLLPSGKPVSLKVSRMRFGQQPWTRNPAREAEARRHFMKLAFKCIVEPESEPTCRHTQGWDVQSETVVQRASWDGSDFCASQQVHLWNEGGLYGYYPRPVLLATPRFCRMFGDLRKGPFRLEVARLV